MPLTSPTNIGRQVAAYTHPVYQEFQAHWTALAHAREGTGGFVDGTYLVAHPREWKDYDAERPQLPTKKLLARRKIARYENWARTIIESKKSALFRESPVRQVKHAPSQPDQSPTGIVAWWADVDGRGCSMDQFLSGAWDAAATFGHVLIVLDFEREAGPGSQPKLLMYTPLDVLDWLEDDYGQLTAVKLQEPAPRSGLDQPVDTGGIRVRIVTETEWALYDSGGARLDGGPHSTGALPAVILYGQRRALISNCGQTVLDNPQLFIDYYNLVSEARELLRNQTFSILNVPLGAGADAMTVEQAKTMMGNQTGTENILFSGLAAGYIAAETANVTVYQMERQQLLRSIFRLAGIQWEADTAGVEAEGALKLKREDMNTRLSAYAGECERTDLALALLWYRAMYGGQVGPVRFTRDGVHISYPTTFDMTPFDEVLQQAESAIALSMPAEVLKQIRLELLPKFLPNLPPDRQSELKRAIEAAEDDPTPADQLRMRLRLEQRAQGGGTPDAAQDEPAQEPAAS